MRAMQRGCVAILAVLSLAVLAAVVRFNREGTISHVNYERILRGMSLAEVERLMGTPGTETFEDRLPGVVDWDVPVDHPRRIKAVVSGERYFQWGEMHVDNGVMIVVSFRDGVVAEKWYYEPSL